MKIVIAGMLTLAVFVSLHISALKKKRWIVLAAYAVGMILLFSVYNYRTLDNIISFYHPKYQSMYQTEFLSGGEYPDAFLDEFFRGRTVYTPNDAYELEDDHTGDILSEKYGDYWLYYYYHAVNMWNYLDLCGAKVIKEDALNGIELTDEQKSRFEDLGRANDMLRYTFALSPYDEEWGNGFYYYWFYNAFIGDSRVYLCTEGLQNDDELVVIWQHTDDHDTDSYYVASKTYFDEVIGR